MIFWIYVVVTTLVIVILEGVIRKVEFDRINNLDEPQMRSARRAAFAVAQLMLAATFIFSEWFSRQSPFFLGSYLLFSCLQILLVNYVSLHFRNTPNSGIRYYSSGVARAASGLISYFRQD